MDINAIIDGSKDMMLEHGEHYPTMFVEFVGSDGIECCVLPDLMHAETNKARISLLFDGGRALGLRKTGHDIAGLCFVNEMWFSSYASKEEMRNAPSPSEDPNRREGLMLLVLEVIPAESEEKPRLKQTAHSFEIIRSGDSLDLLLRNKDDNIETELLTHFLAGFWSARFNDDELDAMFAKTDPSLSRAERRRILRERRKDDAKTRFIDIQRK